MKIQSTAVSYFALMLREQDTHSKWEMARLGGSRTHTWKFIKMSLSTANKAIKCSIGVLRSQARESTNAEEESKPKDHLNSPYPMLFGEGARHIWEYAELRKEGRRAAASLTVGGCVFPSGQLASVVGSS